MTPGATFDLAGFSIDIESAELVYSWTVPSGVTLIDEEDVEYSDGVCMSGGELTGELCDSNPDCTSGTCDEDGNGIGTYSLIYLKVDDDFHSPYCASDNMLSQEECCEETGAWDSGADAVASSCPGTADWDGTEEGCTSGDYNAGSPAVDASCSDDQYPWITENNFTITFEVEDGVNPAVSTTLTLDVIVNEAPVLIYTVESDCDLPIIDGEYESYELCEITKEGHGAR